MILSGLADEAGDMIAEQIRAHKELGWRGIELRTVEGQNVAGALPDEAFEAVVNAVEDAGLEVTGFGSAIGNWSRPITGDFQADIDELRTAAPRMRRLGTRYIRTMSWVGTDVSQRQWRDETIRRYRELTRIAEGEGIILGHENCTGWAGLGPAQSRELIETIGSDHLVVLFDTGNTISHGLEPWAFYEGVRDLIGYVHIKDCRRNPRGGGSSDYSYPGEGDAEVARILTDLFASGYDGVISIEPHIAKVIHDDSSEPDRERMFDSYLKYAREVEQMVERARREAVPA